MKHLSSTISTVILGAALALSACGKKTEPAKPTDPAAAPAADSAKPADPAAPAGDKAAEKKEEGKTGGW